MKKYLLVLLALILVNQFGFGQESRLNRIEFDIEGGPNLSFMYGNSYTVDNVKSGIGFQGGFSFQYNFSRLLAIRTNISFERRVIKNKDEVTFTDEFGNVIGTGTFYNHYNYLVLPILLRTSFGNHLRFFANAGPYIGLLLKGKFFSEITSTGEQTSGTLEDAKKIDLGLSTGIGLSLPLSEHIAIAFEARNNLGLLPINNKEDGDGGAKFNTTEILLSITYGLKK